MNRNKLKLLQVTSMILGGILLIPLSIFLFINTVQGLGPTTGLYAPTDKVAILTADNFNENVYNSSSAWLVQFYNSWCGHCIKFSPVWKQLAADIYNWHNTVTLASIDCANDLNTEHCREYDIMAYPTIRYFKPHTVNFTTGENFPRTRDDIDVLRHDIIIKLESTELKFPSADWPHLKPIKEEDISMLNENTVDKSILVVENETSFLGRELIMDMSSISWLKVRRILKGDYKASPIGEGILIMDRRKEPQIVRSGDSSRSEAVEAVREAYKWRQIPNVLAVNQVNQSHRILVKQGSKQLKMVNTVFEDDLENALHFSLMQEITLKPSISGEALKALTAFLEVIHKYFPFSSDKSFISRVKTELNGKITGGEFKKLLLKYGENFFQKPKSWYGCAGSTGSFRRYPCGLWMMFHTLTVREYLANKSGAGSEVLSVMPMYIKNFFGCGDCAEHFVEMSKTIQGNVSTPEDAVMWLWRAHNNVNRRLAGDGSEDPAFPKVQFPTKEMCPKCYGSDNTWNEGEVLLYLLNMYRNVQVGIQQTLPSVEAVADSRQSELPGNDSAEHSNWNFSLTDVNACIGLYVLSACLLTVYTVRLFLKKGPRSRHHKYEFSYKV